MAHSGALLAPRRVGCTAFHEFPVKIFIILSVLSTLSHPLFLLASGTGIESLLEGIAKKVNTEHGEEDHCPRVDS